MTKDFPSTLCFVAVVFEIFRIIFFLNIFHPCFILYYSLMFLRALPLEIYPQLTPRNFRVLLSILLSYMIFIIFLSNSLTFFSLLFFCFFFFFIYIIGYRRNTLNLKMRPYYLGIALLKFSNSKHFLLIYFKQLIITYQTSHTIL